MSASPCILFVAFPQGEEAPLHGWSRFRELVQTGGGDFAQSRGSETATVEPGADPQQFGTARAGIWRMIASNNRELARSSFLYDSFVKAQSHILHLKENTAGMVVTVVTGPTAGTHGWYVSIDGTPVMTCGRWFRTAPSCHAAAEGTIEAFRLAVVADDPRRAVLAGRRWSRPGTAAQGAVPW